jgi:hypothetical protein
MRKQASYQRRTIRSEFVPCGSGRGAGLGCCNPLAKEKADRFNLKVQFAFRRRYPRRLGRAVLSFRSLAKRQPVDAT